jgi:hypothetical protein
MPVRNFSLSFSLITAVPPAVLDDVCVRFSPVPFRRLLVSVGGAENKLFLKWTARDLHPDGSARFCEATRYAHGRKPGDIKRNRAETICATALVLAANSFAIDIQPTGGKPSIKQRDRRADLLDLRNGVVEMNGLGSKCFLQDQLGNQRWATALASKRTAWVVGSERMSLIHILCLG